MEAVKVPRPTEKEIIMKNLIAGITLITASVIWLVLMICSICITTQPGCMDFVDLPIITIVWLAYFVPGLYFLFLARDKPSP
jgi:hypothetical protein